MTRLLMDIRPLRESAAFRRLWIGSSLSAIGSQMTTFAVALQVYTVTRSSLAVGGIGLAYAVPAIVFGLFGGSIVDAVDRRRLVLLTSSLQTAVAVAFAVQAFAEVDQVWLLYGLVVAQSMIGAVNAPARKTFLPRLLPADLVPAGVALTMFTMHLSLTVGPVLAGLIAAGGGLKMCYVVDAVSFAGALYGVARLPAMRPEGGGARPGLRAVAEGLRFIRGNRVITGAFLADINATLLGMPFALFPAINAEHFGGAEQTLGLLTAAPAIGGILGTALSGRLVHVTRQGRAILILTVVWGASLAGFGLARSLWLALALLALAGAADVLSVVFRTSIVQVATPDQYRGRVGATEFVVGAAVPQVGNFRAGAVGSLTSPAFSAVSGGLATVVGAALIALTLPAFAGYRAPSRAQAAASEEPVAAEPVAEPTAGPA